HIVHKWQDDALKVVSQAPLTLNEWTHVCVTYDGSKKAAGVKVYYNGKPQPTNIAADKLQNTIRTTVPFKIGQRSTDHNMQFMAVADLRVFARGLSAQEAAGLATSEQIEDFVAKAADQRTAEEKSKAFDWWLTSVDASSKKLDGQLKKLQQEEAQVKARGTV